LACLEQVSMPRGRAWHIPCLAPHHGAIRPAFRSLMMLSDVTQMTNQRYFTSAMIISALVGPVLVVA
jgi:hypothetical protein